MRQRLFLYYEWFLQNLKKGCIRTNMHTTVAEAVWLNDRLFPRYALFLFTHFALHNSNFRAKRVMRNKLCLCNGFCTDDCITIKKNFPNFLQVMTSFAHKNKKIGTLLLLYIHLFPALRAFWFLKKKSRHTKIAGCTKTIPTLLGSGKITTTSCSFCNNNTTGRSSTNKLQNRVIARFCQNIRSQGRDVNTNS